MAPVVDVVADEATLLGEEDEEVELTMLLTTLVELELVALVGTLVMVEVVVFTELVVLVFVLVLVLVGSATDFVVYGTTVVLTGIVDVTVLVVLMKHDLPMESAQLVVLMVVVVSIWSLVLILACLVGLLQGQRRSKTHKRY